MIIDQLKPYFAIIRIVGYAILIGFLFVSGCNYGKQKSGVKIAQLEAARDACLSANQANQSAIDALTEANKDFADNAKVDKEKQDAVIKDLKDRVKRAESAQEATKKELGKEYAKNKEWASGRVPNGIVRLLDKAGKD